MQALKEQRWMSGFSGTKFNPYRPGSIVAPGMFSGRGNEIMAIERCLFQTKHGNPQSFIIEGERGIGKSSLMLLVNMFAKGEVPYTSPDGKNAFFNFIVIDLELDSNTETVDIIQNIGKSLRRQLALTGNLKTLAAGTFDFLTNWKVLGVEYKKNKDLLDPIEAISDLAQAMKDLINSSGVLVDGILILIDEADKPEPEVANLGEICKLLTERLAKINCNNVCIGMAGLPTIIPKLRQGHESSLRLFIDLPLGTLSEPDRIEVVKKGLLEATPKNGYETTCDPEASELIGHLSEGYPHFLQEFSFAAFNADADRNICVNDVTGGVFSDGGAIHQLGKRYFESLYYEKISSTDYRRVLIAMADHSDQWISRKDIIRISGVKEGQVNNALAALKSRNIILSNDNKSGEYRLPTKSFAVWLKILENRPEADGSAL